LPSSYSLLLVPTPPLTTICISVSVIAVHGLGSNPQTTWQTRRNGRQIASLVSASSEGPPEAVNTANAISPNHIWLRDFLPQENLGVRVMLFNHNTAWETNALSKSLRDYGEDLLGELCEARKTDKVRTNAIRNASKILIMVPFT
jgi:hypothetical protein